LRANNPWASMLAVFCDNRCPRARTLGNCSPRISLPRVSMSIEIGEPAATLNRHTVDIRTRRGGHGRLGPDRRSSRPRRRPIDTPSNSNHGCSIRAMSGRLLAENPASDTSP
jgi:hypothetical protein